MSFFGFKIWRVTDFNMAPAIPKNSYIIVNHWFKFQWFYVGSTILLQHHFYGLLLKKIAVIDTNGFIWTRGENSQSLAIEHIGPVSKNQVIGHVLWVVKPPKKGHKTLEKH